MSSNKIIDRKIATFITNRDKLKKLAHDIAILIFDHAHDHGDCTRAIKLASALPNSWQPQMEAWFKAFTPIRVVIKNGKCEFDPAYKRATTENKASFWDRDEAVATPFYDLMEEPKVDKVLDFAALVALVQRLGKQIEKKIEEGKVAEDDVESAKSIARTVSSLAFNRVPVTPANEDDKNGNKDDSDNDEGVPAVAAVA